jgi:hypothetical protein
MKTNLYKFWQCIDMDSIGPGDDDVYTKRGRHTDISISMSKPTLDGKRLKTQVVYNINEGRRDYTHLTLTKDVIIPFPSNWKKVTILGADAYQVDMTIYDKNHKWNPIGINTVNWIQRLEVKIDGPGGDADGNAGIRIHFNIPVEVTT